MKAARKISFKLNSIKCLLNSEYQGDEIYVRYDGKKIWPEDRKWHRMRSGDEAILNIILPVENIGRKVDLELWENDFLRHSRLGSFIFLLDSLGGPFTVDMFQKDGKAKYSLVWEALYSKQMA